MRELDSRQAVADASGGQPMAVWAAGRLGHGGRAWAQGCATLVAAPDLSLRDRAVVTGPADDVVALVRHAWARLGRSFRPYGAPPLIAELRRRIPGLRPITPFGWMDTPAGAPPTPPVGPPVGPANEVRWLADDELSEAADLVTRVYPSSYARPGVPGVRRWAGIRDAHGRLVATGADAWSAPAVGFVSGVVTHPDVRGTGLGARLCAFLVSTLLAEHGTVALMVDDWNTQAIRLYGRLGLTYRPIAAAEPT